MTTDFAGPYARELEVASRLGREAGAIALGFRGGALGVQMKPGDEPVTAADHAASDLIVAGLRAAFPDDWVISEEAIDAAARPAEGRAWFVDPIDGTRDFMNGRDGFSVMIGLAVAGRPVVGVIYQPVGARLFAAAPGYGAWFHAPDAPPRALRCSTVADTASIRLVASRSHRTGEIDEVKSALGIRDELNIGSVGLKLGLIALGERDLYVNPGSRTKTWDTCAPEALLVLAGGRITDARGGALDYSTPAGHHARGLVASNGLLHDEVLDKVRPLLPAAR